MDGPWDAPLELRDQYADAEDPRPGEFVEVPNRWLVEDYDPDDLLSVVHAYAGQVSLLDLCLGGFCEQLNDSGLTADTQLTLIGARLSAGRTSARRFLRRRRDHELVGIPWLMRFADGQGRFARSQALVQPPDLPGTLLDLLAADRGNVDAGNASSLLDIITEQRESIRERAYLISRDEQAIRTPAWFLRQPLGEPPELYAKPSDRWEVNEVARLCPQVVAGLQAALSQICAGHEDQLPRLADELVIELD